MATNRYPNSSSEMTPTMTVSIALLHLVAEAHVQRADDKKRDDNSDVNQISHKDSRSLRVKLSHVS